MIILKKRFLLSLLLITIFFACTHENNNNYGEVKKIVGEWTGKEILIPEKISCYLADKDTLLGFCNELFDKEYKILMYVDSAGCSDCRLKLFEWKQLMKEADSLFQGEVGFLLFFQPKRKMKMTNLFKIDKFDYPVFVDVKGEIDRLNHFPQAMEYQCFLLNKENRVLVIGNPVLNPKILDLYKSQITGGKKAKQEAFTTIMVDKRVIEYGNIKKGSLNPAIFIITNTGSHPLITYRVSTSCGCTNVEWESRPVEQGQVATISVKMTPDEAGYFSKTIDVYCNIKESPLRLMVNGNASE